MENITMNEILVVIARISRVWAFTERVIKAVNTGLDSKLNPLQQDIDMCLKMQLSMMEHLSTGNHQDEMKKLQTQVTDYLVKRKHA